MYVEAVKTVLTIKGENLVAEDQTVKFPNTLAEAVELAGGEQRLVQLYTQIRRTKEQQRLRKLLLAREAPDKAPREITARRVDLSQPPPTAQPKVTRARAPRPVAQAAANA